MRSTLLRLLRPAPRRSVSTDAPTSPVQVVSATIALYHIFVPITWMLPLDTHLAVHLCVMVALTFLVLGRSHGRALGVLHGDMILVGLSLVLCVYFVLSIDTLSQRAIVISPLSTAQVAAAAALLLLTLEASRRAVGLPFVAVMCGFFLLMYLGPHLPGIWAHGGMNVVEILDVTVWTRLHGLWGVPLRMSATLIVLFLIFGKLMQHSGLGQLLTSLCQDLAGGARGGPAKVAVVGSALVGSVTGGPATNMIMTGSITIPMMKDIGYRPHYAGAVEAAASTGASIVPPVMTGIIFIMAELTGTSYVRLMLLAVIPAALYFTCLLVQVHLQAVHTGMRGNGKGPDFTKAWQGLKMRGHLLIPIVVLLGLLVAGYYPSTAVLWAIPTVPLSAALRGQTRMRLTRIFTALAEASQELTRIAPVCALSGVVIVALFQTGLGSTFSHLVSTAAGQSLLLLAILGGAACLILGMGVPPMAAYLMTVLIVAPLMVNSGVPVLVAHFFSLYYANMAFITPPVAVGVLVASGLSGSGFWLVGLTAMRLAAVGFVLPLALVYRPALLFFGGPFDVLWAVVVCVILVICLAAAFEGWMMGWLPGVARLLLAGAGLMLIPPNLVANTVALIIVSGIVLWQMKERRARNGPDARVQ